MLQSGRGQVPEAQQGETRVPNALTGSRVGNMGLLWGGTLAACSYVSEATSSPSLPGPS